MKYVTDETIGNGLIVEGGKLAVAADGETIKLEDGKLVASSREVSGGDLLRLTDCKGLTTLATVAKYPPPDDPFGTDELAIVAASDLSDHLTIGRGNRVWVNVYRDYVYTNGFITLDLDNRLVLRDALFINPHAAIDLGQLNVMDAKYVGLDTKFPNTAHAHHYVLTFNLYNKPRNLRGGTIWLRSTASSESITGLMWVDRTTLEEVTPDGVDIITDNGSMGVSAHSIDALNAASSGNYLVFKHADDTNDYATTYGSFEAELQGGLTVDSYRWRFDPAVDMGGVNWPLASTADDEYLVRRAFTFKVYG